MRAYPENMIPRLILANMARNSGQCGCEEHPMDPTRWNLCHYHDGMCDGWWMHEATTETET